ncbi:MAG: PHP domain-containing protein [Clostridia bacterium]|nr:PHP domain-containing protein [Clostridia bacterium]
MQICDMHVHSCFSDGSSTPAQLIEEGLSVGLSAIALTDHNNIGGAEEFLKASCGKDIKAVVGTEFSTDYGDKELHILGLFIQKEHFKKVTAYCERVILNKEKSNRVMIDRLKKAGYDIDYDEVKRNCQGTMNRAHIGAVLFKKGYTKTIEEVFDTILSKSGGIYESAKRLDAFETIKFIRSIGAVPVLAHPFLDLNESELRVFLAKATANGLIGMETEYTTYSPEQTFLARQIASEFGLKRSGGSDYHGCRKENVALATGRGNLAIPYSIYQDLRPEKGE